MTQFDKFCFDGIAYNDIPSRISKLTDGYGVTTDYVQVFDASKVVIGTLQPSEPGTFDYAQRNPSQAYTVVWDPEATVIRRPMYQHLKKLWESQEAFWIQFDNEMSREYGIMTLAGHEFTKLNKQKVFVAPTYPIFPYGSSDDAPTDWAQTDVTINSRYTNARFTVDQENGLLIFDDLGYKLNQRDRVTLKYTWRMLVRIKEFSLNVSRIAQTYYDGSVTFEQVTGVEAPPCVWSNYVN
jgi:hypothetical protein